LDTLDELRTLQRDLTDLGDAVAVALLERERAERCFLSRQFDAGKRYLEQALNHFEETQRRKPETQGIARHFAACTFAVP